MRIFVPGFVGSAWAWCISCSAAEPVASVEGRLIDGTKITWKMSTSEPYDFLCIETRYFDHDKAIALNKNQLLPWFDVVVLTWSTWCIDVELRGGIEGEQTDATKKKYKSIPTLCRQKEWGPGPFSWNQAIL